jgi:hypothetical protein
MNGFDSGAAQRASDQALQAAQNAQAIVQQDQQRQAQIADERSRQRIADQRERAPYNTRSSPPPGSLRRGWIGAFIVLAVCVVVGIWWMTNFHH